MYDRIITNLITTNKIWITVRACYIVALDCNPNTQILPMKCLFGGVCNKCWSFSIFSPKRDIFCEGGWGWLCNYDNCYNTFKFICNLLQILPLKHLLANVLRNFVATPKPLDREICKNNSVYVIWMGYTYLNWNWQCHGNICFNRRNLIKFYLFEI